MDNTMEQWTIPEGTDVITADGDKIGKVIAAQDDYIVVEKGFFFPTDYYVPTSAVSSYDGDKVYLGVTKDQALNQRWEVAPAVAETDRLVGSGTMGAATTTRGEMGDTIRVPVHEEELTATKRPVERGQVRIDKDVVTEQRTLDVPVTEERARIERRAVDREAPTDADAFRKETIEVPIRGEEVELQKRTRVAEEVEIGKETTQRTERAADTIRREAVRVDDSGTAGAGTTAASRWTPATAADYSRLIGNDVFSADGEKVGTVEAVYSPSGDVPSTRGGHYFLLDSGLLKDWFGGLDEVYLPESAIDGVTADRLNLNLTDDQLKAGSWARPTHFASYRPV
jgi:uncharacterized protein (TIGR02271 family)